MKGSLALLIVVCMLCVSISGAAVSFVQSNNANIVNNEYPINLPTESPEVNTKLLKNINQQVNKYMNL